MLHHTSNMNPTQHSSLTNASENMHATSPRKFSLNLTSPTNNTIINNNNTTTATSSPTITSNNNNNNNISTKEHLDMNYKILMQQQLLYNQSQTTHQSPLRHHNFNLNQQQDPPQLITSNNNNNNNNSNLIFPMSPPPQHINVGSFYALPQPYYYLSNAVASNSFHAPIYHDSFKQSRSNSFHLGNQQPLGGINEHSISTVLPQRTKLIVSTNTNNCLFGRVAD